MKKGGAQQPGGWPKDFMWGVATAAHQVEGGNNNDWTDWEQETAEQRAASAERRLGHLPSWPDIRLEAEDPANYISGIMGDHYHRYESDFDLAAGMGCNTFRFSVEWSRIEPEHGRWQDAEVEHYRRYIAAIRARGMEPVMTLMHYTLPKWFAARGGFENQKNTHYFVDFCRRFMQEVGDQVTYVVTINEPDTVAALGCLAGEYPPGAHSTFRTARLYLNQLRVHNKVYKSLKKLNKNLCIGMVKSYAWAWPGDRRWLSKIASQFELWWRDDWTLRIIGRNQDFIGVNFYFSNRYFGWRTVNENKRLNDFGWDMQPQFLEQVLRRLAKWRLPIIVTETGLADAEDKYRSWWLDETVAAVDRAMAAGAPVKGYLFWSLTDNFEWANGRWPRFGLYGIDYSGNLRRVERPSAAHYREIIRGTRRKAGEG